ncbi:hypothetical protein ACT4S5_09825 [Kocuria oceani]|uniref:hypothetical protein n=1 Tax=Kocuria oceani TaxID=988827 RepID=UPI004035DF6C
MDLPGVPAGRHIVRGAAFGAADGAVLALFTRNGHSIDLGVLVGVALELLRARVRGDLTAPAADDGPMTGTPSSRRLDPLQAGLLCGLAVGVVVGVVVAALTRQLFWIAACTGCGAGAGWLLGRARTRPHEDGTSTRDGRPRAGTAQQEDERDEQARAAGPPPPSRRRTAPPPEPRPTCDPPPEVMARARDEDLLKGVLVLVLDNRRHARPGREPVDIRAALGDLHDEAAIEDAILRTEELLAHAVNLGYGARDARDDRAELQLAHPGFSPEHLAEALSWGHRSAR